MRQYLDAKQQHRDALLFFRMGDFFEMFYEDALVAARALELTLTSRSKDASGGGIPMCGVPFHAADTYIARLIKKGFRVAICDQVEDPKKAKGLVKREDVHELGAIVAGKAKLRRDPGAILYYKNNTGLAMQFAAAGAIVARKMAAAGGDTPSRASTGISENPFALIERMSAMSTFIAIIGTRSSHAPATAFTRFEAPGPSVDMHTPGRPVRKPQASAIRPAVPSRRPSTNSSPARRAASMNSMFGSPG